MARALKETTDAAPGGYGHNSGDMPEEAVFITHLNKLRAQQKKAEAKKAEYDAERTALTDLFRQAKADGFSRKELQAILDDSGASRRDLQAEEERRVRLRAWAGLPAGVQGDLFANTPEAARDELDAEGAGYAAGLRGDDQTMPDNFAPHYAPAFLRGWNAGQERLAWAMAEAGKNPERKDGAEAKPVDLDPEDEEEAIDAAARKLKRAGFLETKADDAPEAEAA